MSAESDGTFHPDIQPAPEHETFGQKAEGVAETVAVVAELGAIAAYDVAASGLNAITGGHSPIQPVELP